MIGICCQSRACIIGFFECGSSFGFLFTIAALGYHSNLNRWLQFFSTSIMLVSCDFCGQFKVSLSVSLRLTAEVLIESEGACASLVFLASARVNNSRDNFGS